MGYSLIEIPVEHGKTVIRAWAWEVYEASKEEYFNNKKWLRNVVRTEAKDNADEIVATLKNGDFVTLERKLP